METTMKFLTKNLQTSYKELTGTCRKRYIRNKRWVVILFYILKGERQSTIARLLKIDRSSVRNAFRKAEPELRVEAQNFYNVYNNCKPIKFEPEQRLTLVPDYKHNKVVQKWI